MWKLVAVYTGDGEQFYGSRVTIHEFRSREAAHAAAQYIHAHAKDGAKCIVLRDNDQLEAHRHE